jgi:hypothetical protein
MTTRPPSRASMIASPAPRHASAPHVHLRSIAAAYGTAGLHSAAGAIERPRGAMSIPLASDVTHAARRERAPGISPGARAAARGRSRRRRAARVRPRFRSPGRRTGCPARWRRRGAASCPAPRPAGPLCP